MLRRHVWVLCALSSCSSFSGTDEPEDAGAASDAGASEDADAAAVPDAGGQDGASDAANPSPSALRFRDGGYAEGIYVAVPPSFTIEAWVRPIALPDSGTEAELVSEDLAGDVSAQFRLGVLPDGRIFFLMSDGDGSDHGIASGSDNHLVSRTSLAAGVWSHVAVTRGGRTFQLYVNGTPDTLITVNVFTRNGPTAPLRLASRARNVDGGLTTDSPFDGDMDEIRIWSVARSGSQIAAAMKTEIPATTDGLFLYWTADEGTGPSTVDRVQSFPLTLAPGADWVSPGAF